MKLEFRTIKKNLNKSIVNQMLELEMDEVAESQLLGFCVNVSPIKKMVLLFKIKDMDYRIAYMDWKLQETSLSRPYKIRHTTQKQFESEQDAETYFNYIQECKEKAEQIYI